MLSWPIGLTPRRAALTFAINQSKRFGLSRRKRGCHKVLRLGIDRAADIAIREFSRISIHLGDLKGKTGLEIGPGDNLGLAHCFLANGAARVYALERYATVQISKPLRDSIHAHFGSTSANDPQLEIAEFESFRGPSVDFVYSI